MTALPWIAAGVGAAAVGAVYLVRRSSAPAPTAPPADNCEKLRAIGGQQAVDACKAVKAGLGVVGAVAGVVQNATESRESKNVTLNGPITERIDVGANRGYQGADGTWHRILHGGNTAVGVRHQNGCVPIPGHPDWGKCAPDTRHIIDNGNLDDADHYAGNSYWAVTLLPAGFSKAGLLSGDPMRDALTFKAPASMQPATGELWFVRGKRLTCPAGTTVNGGRDHRTGTNIPVCAAPSSATPPPPVIAPDANGCISYRTADGRTVRDCRTGATVPPGATPLSTEPVYRSDPIR